MPPIPWKQCLSQPPAWYGGAEADRIAGNVLLYQRATGGWPKNTEMTAVLAEAERAEILRQKRLIDSTIDNGATYTEMAFLARVYDARVRDATKREPLRRAFLDGLDYLLRAQYASGGWPQFYPLRRGYYTHITFNDDAMVGVLSLLRAVTRKESPYAFVDAGRRVRAERAVAKGVECILRCQIIIDGKRTVWCAQHDENTFAPAPARAYEKISLSGSESVGITRFLMGTLRPDPRVIAAIEGAVAWFEAAKLTGIKVVERPDAALPKGFDRVVVADPAAPPIWARFYEIGTNRPIFCGRDGVIKARLADIEHERRIGYSWYTDRPARLLETDYPAWRKRRGIPPTSARR